MGDGLEAAMGEADEHEGVREGSRDLRKVSRCEDGGLGEPDPRKRRHEGSTESSLRMCNSEQNAISMPILQVQKLRLRGLGNKPKVPHCVEWSSCN